MNKQKWIDTALQLGFEGLEIYQSTSASKEVTWYNGQMDTFVTSRVIGTSIRGIVDGKVSYISMEEVDDDKMEDTLKMLKEQALTVTSDEKAYLSKPQDIHPKENNKTWISPSMEYLYKVMAEIEEKVKNYDPRVMQMASLGWTESSNNRSIVNSYGVNLSEGSGAQYMVCSVAVSDGREVKDNYLIKLIPDLSKFDTDAFVKELIDEAIFKLGGKPIPSQQTKVILEKEAMSSLLAAFAGLFSGELIYKGISPLKGKLGDKIFSDKITIIDDPRNEEALELVNFDDEGVPTREKVVVNKGVFETILHSNKSAAAMGQESTGNGFKGGYSGTVSVSPENMYIVPGDKDLDALCEKMGNGLVITDVAGLHAGLDFVSTRFSLQSEGYWVKDGKKDRPVALITCASSFMELMNQVVEVGSDLDWKYHEICAPSILFEKISVSGE